MTTMFENKICITTYSHPDGKSDPCSSVQLHHQEDINKHAYNWNKGQQRDLRKQYRVTKNQYPGKSVFQIFKINRIWTIY